MCFDMHHVDFVISNLTWGKTDENSPYVKKKLKHKK